MSGASVAVVGSLNLDIVVSVDHHPRPGETVIGGPLFTNQGGKGANQAVAAARLGQQVALVGGVGDDDSGRNLLEALNREGVDATHVRVMEDEHSGSALIAVDPEGENTIVVSPGANALVSPDDIYEAGPLLEHAAVTLLQLEVPLEAVDAAAKSAGGTVVLNPAPFRGLPDSLLDHVDLLVPNAGELAALAGEQTSDDLDDVAEMASRIHGPEAVVVTLGARGALLASRGSSRRVAAPRVDVVDTTAAGDCFCGALADALVRELSFEAAVEWAVRCASLSTTRKGAQPSLPTRAEVEALTDAE
ncbi:MAG: ribokinase [Actinomycetota bacterium]